MHSTRTCTFLCPPLESGHIARYISSHCRQEKCIDSGTPTCKVYAVAFGQGKRSELHYIPSLAAMLNMDEQVSRLVEKVWSESVASVHVSIDD